MHSDKYGGLTVENIEFARKVLKQINEGLRDFEIDRLCDAAISAVNRASSGDSDTPRTDAILAYESTNPRGCYDDVVKLARQLERELAVAKRCMHDAIAQGEKMEAELDSVASATRPNVDEIRDQCIEGLKAKHDCPAVYALAAIYAEILDASATPQPEEGAIK